MTASSRTPGKKQVRQRLLGLVLLFLVAGSIAYAVPANWVFSQLSRLVGINIGQINKPFVLGLDLQSGSRLEYEADVARVPEAERKEALNGVRDVIERRVNALGVSEPLIQTLRAGESWRVNVELAGIRDIQEAIKLIGETPILEFKTENTEKPRDLTADEKKRLDTENAAAKKKTETILAEALKPGTDFARLAQDNTPSTTTSGGSQANPATGKIVAPADVYSEVKDLAAGTVLNKVLERSHSYAVVKVEEVKEAGKEVEARHLLIAFQGAEGDLAERSKDDARKKIEELKKQATVENFEELVKKNSDEPGATDTGGLLGWFGEGAMVEPFEKAVFPQAKGTISEVVETAFGFHLIQKMDERPLKDVQVRMIEVKKMTDLDIVPPVDPWMATKLTGKQLQSARVDFDPNTSGIRVALQFDDEGAKSFADITKQNIGKPLAIFLDGEMVSNPPPIVQDEIIGGQAVITGNFTLNEAKLMARRLQSGALPVPIKIIAQQTVGPTLGLDSLQKSLYAGIVGFLLVALYMILLYRLPGLVSVAALVLYAALSATVFKLLPVTLTLSGIAGFILSIGIAVDANVLVFERLKEEWREGKGLSQAMEDAFRRAWLSIRDGHMTVLISCAVLYWFSSSVIKGFALTLAIGTLISLFTAVVSTRTILRSLVTTRVGRYSWWFLKPKEVEAHK
jgi:protein-export membrane protein SecD